MPWHCYRYIIINDDNEKPNRINFLPNQKNVYEEDLLTNAGDLLCGNGECAGDGY